MARITWQNVDAPNFSGVVEAQAQGTQGFQSALEGIGGFLKDIDGQQRSKASTRAMEEMLKIQEVGGWDKAMKSGVFQSLGINSDMATTGLLDMIGARRDNLESDRTTDFDHTQAVYAQNRSEITDGRSDQEYQRGEESRARGIEALRIANEQAGTAVSREEAQRQIMKLNLDPQLESETVNQLGALPDHWAVGPEAKLGNANTQSQVNTLGRAMSAQKNELDFQYQGNRALQLYVDAPQRYSGYSTPLNGLFDRLNATVSQEDAESFSQSKGNITQLYNRLSKDYSDVPAGVIASVMENTIKEAGWIPFMKDGIKIGERDVRLQLEELGSVENRAGLQQQAQAYQDRTASIEQDGSTISRLQNEILVLQEKGAPASRIEEKEKAIEEIYNRYGGADSDPAASLMAAARAGAGMAATSPAAAILAQGDSRAQAQMEAATAAATSPAAALLARAAQPAPSVTPSLTGAADRLMGRAAGTVLDLVNGPTVEGRQMREGGISGLLRAGSSEGAAPVEHEAPAALVERIQEIGESTGMPPEALGRIAESIALMDDPNVPSEVREAARTDVGQFLQSAEERAAGGDATTRRAVQRAKSWVPQRN